jgi:hypothetical protein
MLDQGVFQNIGSVTWDTTAKTSGFTAVSGNGYFCNTTSSAFTVTLPSSPSAGDIVGIKDYANTADTNTITIGRNGSNIQGVADDFKLEIEGGAVFLVYVDGTQGWKVTSSAQNSDIKAPFITATGGTITTSGDYKIHTFTGPGTFTVTCAGSGTPSSPSNVDYLVVAGGAGGGTNCTGSYDGGGGGGGAGGYRSAGHGPAPLQGSSLPISVTSYPITVGGGGAAGTAGGTDPGSNGSNSVFSTITSTGGGGGAGTQPQPLANRTGEPGGSGGGGGNSDSPGGVGGSAPGGSGNSPPVSPSQGNNGGASGFGPTTYTGGGGGGATASGGAGGGVSAPTGGVGGAGAPNDITASSVSYAGGGGGGGPVGGAGGTSPAGGTSGGVGGSSGGSPVAGAGTVNTGGGGGGVGRQGGGPAAAGGSGIVIIRYKYQ